DAAFRARFTKSPVKRIGRDRFVRNVLIAIGNSNDPALAAEAERLLDDAAFRTRFTKSPVKRIGRDRFVRNVLIAIGNSGDAALAVEAERLRDDASPLVRGAAAWALSQLMAREAFAALAARMMGAEADETVRAEWRRG
ncbi:MAG: hypothetical protein Q7U92_00235, partial [Bradyrhizobium sp.]|nr:hypothetical protein [Bradyrhizobium sp.]